MRNILDFSFPYNVIVILRFQRFRVLPLVNRVLVSWQSIDYLLFSHRLKILRFLWLSSKYRLKGVFHQVKNISAQSLHLALYIGKIFMLYNPKL